MVDHCKAPTSLGAIPGMQVQVGFWMIFIHCYLENFGSKELSRSCYVMCIAILCVLKTNLNNFERQKAASIWLVFISSYESKEFDLVIIYNLLCMI